MGDLYHVAVGAVYGLTSAIIVSGIVTGSSGLVIVGTLLIFAESLVLWIAWVERRKAIFSVAEEVVEIYAGPEGVEEYRKNVGKYS